MVRGCLPASAIWRLVGDGVSSTQMWGGSAGADRAAIIAHPGWPEPAANRPIGRATIATSAHRSPCAPAGRSVVITARADRQGAQHAKVLVQVNLYSGPVGFGDLHAVESGALAGPRGD